MPAHPDDVPKTAMDAMFSSSPPSGVGHNHLGTGAATLGVITYTPSQPAGKQAAAACRGRRR